MNIGIELVRLNLHMNLANKATQTELYSHYVLWPLYLLQIIITSITLSIQPWCSKLTNM